MISFMTKTVSWNVRSKYHETEEFRFLFRKLTCVAKTRVYVQDFLEKYGQPRNNYVERNEMNVRICFYEEIQWKSTENMKN